MCLFVFLVFDAFSGLQTWEEPAARWPRPRPLRPTGLPSASTWSSRRCSRTGDSAYGRESWRAGASTCNRGPPRIWARDSSSSTSRTRRGILCRGPRLAWTSSSRWSSRTSASWWRPWVLAKGGNLCWSTWGRSRETPCRRAWIARCPSGRWCWRSARCQSGFCLPCKQILENYFLTQIFCFV